MSNILEYVSSLNFKKLIILGAGFSYDAGLPLEKDVIPNAIDFFSKYDNNFLEILRTKCNKLLKIDNFDELSIEEMLTKIKIMEFYSRPKMDYYFDILPVTQGILKLFSQTLRLPENFVIPDIYKDFIKLYNQDTFLITFNNDLLLEYIFEENGIQWSYIIPNIEFEQKFYKYYYDMKSIQKDIEFVPYVKLHGSFNWFYCWKCERVYVSSKQFGVPFTGIPESWFFMKHCMNNSCQQSDGARPVLESLIIPPTLIKYYELKFIQSLWTIYESILNKIQQLIIIGSSLRSEDILFINSLSNLNYKNFELNEIVFVNPDKRLISRLKHISNLNIIHYNSLIDFVKDTR